MSLHRKVNIGNIMDQEMRDYATTQLGGPSRVVSELQGHRVSTNQLSLISEL